MNIFNFKYWKMTWTLLPLLVFTQHSHCLWMTRWNDLMKWPDEMTCWLIKHLFYNLYCCVETPIQIKPDLSADPHILNHVIKMFMVLCTLFIHINIIPFRQKIHLIWTEYYSEHNVYVIALAGVWTPDAWVTVHHTNQCTQNSIVCWWVMLYSFILHCHGAWL